MTLLALKMEGKDHEPGNAGSFQKLEKARKQILPSRLRKERNPASTLVLGLLTSRNECMVFQDTEFAVICYSNNRKLTQSP